jgi:hypothetical protein
MNKESRKIEIRSKSGNHESMNKKTKCQSGSDFLGSWLPD